MKSAEEFVNDLPIYAENIIERIKQRDAEIRSETIQSCIAIVQHHNVNLMSAETAKQSIIKALMTMVEK